MSRSKKDPRATTEDILIISSQIFGTNQIFCLFIAEQMT